MESSFAVFCVQRNAFSAVCDSFVVEELRISVYMLYLYYFACPIQKGPYVLFGLFVLFELGRFENGSIEKDQKSDV